MAYRYAPPLGDGQPLWRAIAEEPFDSLRKMVLADWLEDHGKHLEVAAALRWCGRRGKHPSFAPGSGFWYWWIPSRIDRDHTTNVIPIPLGEAQGPHASAWSAFRDLGRVILRLRAAVAD